MLIVVCGLQGSGKSTVAQKIAQRKNALLLRTDVIRKEMFSKPKYTQEEMQAVYQEMFKQARAQLGNSTIVLDATFKDHKNREDARLLAESLNHPFTLVHTTCDEDVLKERITRRSNDASDARFEQYLQTKAAFEPIHHVHVSIDTTQGYDAIEQQITHLF